MIKEEVRQLKKCCKKIAYSTSLCFETNTLWYISYPEPIHNPTKQRKTRKAKRNKKSLFTSSYKTPPFSLNIF